MLTHKLRFHVCSCCLCRINLCPVMWADLVSMPSTYEEHSRRLFVLEEFTTAGKCPEHLGRCLCRPGHDVKISLGFHMLLFCSPGPYGQNVSDLIVFPSWHEKFRKMCGAIDSDICVSESIFCVFPESKEQRSEHLLVFLCHSNTHT